MTTTRRLASTKDSELAEKALVDMRRVLPGGVSREMDQTEVSFSMDPPNSNVFHCGPLWLRREKTCPLFPWIRCSVAKPQFHILILMLDIIQQAFALFSPPLQPSHTDLSFNLGAQNYLELHASFILIKIGESPLRTAYFQCEINP